MKGICSLVVLAACLSACGSSPTSPSSVVPPVRIDVTGNWTGQYTIARCSDTTGFSLCTAGTGGGFTLTVIEDSSNRLSGTMRFGSVSGNISGAATNEGSMALNTWSFNQPLAGATGVWRASSQQFQANGATLAGGFHINLTTTVTAGAFDADASLVNVFR